MPETTTDPAGLRLHGRGSVPPAASPSFWRTTRLGYRRKFRYRQGGCAGSCRVGRRRRRHNTLSTTQPRRRWRTKSKPAGACDQGRRQPRRRRPAMFVTAADWYNPHRRQQRRSAAGLVLARYDDRAMEQGACRQPDRPIPVRAGSGTRVQEARCGARNFRARRQDRVHELGPSGDSLGRPRQLCRIEGRRDAADASVAQEVAPIAVRVNGVAPELSVLRSTVRRGIPLSLPRSDDSCAL